MECVVCLEPLDTEARRPKVTPCGHTVCLCCLRTLHVRECPLCRKKLPSVDMLVDNFYLLGVLEGVSARPGPRSWCSKCGRAAAAGCLEEHKRSVADARTALCRRAQDAVRRADTGALAEELGGCGEEEAMAALSLLSSGGDAAWSLRLSSGDAELSARWPPPDSRPGAAPVLEVLAAILATRCGLREVRDGGRGQEPVRFAAQGPSAPPMELEQLGPQEPTVVPGTRHGGAGAGARRVRRLRVKDMDCHMDPEWTLQLLYDLSMSADEVQEAQVWRPSWDHLSVLHTMPHLRRLFLYHCYDVDAGAALPALPEGRAGLHTLRVDELPRRPLASLLRAHGSSLHTLILFVGTGGGRRVAAQLRRPPRPAGRVPPDGATCAAPLQVGLRPRWPGLRRPAGRGEAAAAGRRVRPVRGVRRRGARALLDGRNLNP